MSYHNIGHVKFRFIPVVFLLLTYLTGHSKTWIDSIDIYARERISPPQSFSPSWQNAPLLHAMEFQYDRMPAPLRQQYLDYVKTAMDRNLLFLNGLLPNTVAPVNGVAFLYRATGDPKYLDVALRIYRQYKNILKTSNGGVSHLFYTRELWDDTVYMIGVYLLSMYRATGDETYLLEVLEQIKKHREKLAVDTWGLWVHGWDDDNAYDLDFCSQFDWADPITRRSAEIWGRGNGWVVLTLSEILNNLPESHPQWDTTASLLKEMIINLPGLQDENNGHWYQLPVRKGEPGNYPESSCTAMFGYGILTALKHGIVQGEAYEQAVNIAYYGLRNYSVALVGNHDKPYLNTKNVALETCLGDKAYYFGISTGGGKAYASGVYIIFGRAYEAAYLNGEPTSTPRSNNNLYSMELFPVPATAASGLHVKFTSPSRESVQYLLTDLTGKVMYSQAEVLSAGENRSLITPGPVPAGTYILQVKNRESAILRSSLVILQ